MFGKHPISYLLTVAGGALSVLLGATVILGWYTHNESLIQVSAAFVPMQFNTALGFLFCGLGLLVVARGYRGAGLVLGVVLMFIGLLTLTQYVFAIDLGIDQLLMQHYIMIETSHPGRMAPNTALCFSLMGAALVVANTMPKESKYSLYIAVLGSLTFGLGVVALTGYMVGLETAYGWGALTRMAVHTATGFMVLGIAATGFAWHRHRTSTSFQ